MVKQKQQQIQTQAGDDTKSHISEAIVGKDSV